MTTVTPTANAEARTIEQIEQQREEIDRMMAAAADRDLAEPWQAVQAAMLALPNLPEHARLFCDALHAALVAQGHDPDDRSTC